MTRSTNNPDADYTPNDIGPPETSNGPEVSDDFEDQEVERLLLERLLLEEDTQP